MGARTTCPIRMRGTCIDITDRVLADAERERDRCPFPQPGGVGTGRDPGPRRATSGSSRRQPAGPRAAAAVDAAGPRRWRTILPAWHDADGQRRRAPPASTDDGCVLDVTTAAVNPEDDAERRLSAVFLRDAKTRLDGEAMASRLGRGPAPSPPGPRDQRQRRAGPRRGGVRPGPGAGARRRRAYLDQTLSAARAMMDDLLEPLDGEGLQPGDLVRADARGDRHGRRRP